MKAVMSPCTMFANHDNCQLTFLFSCYAEAERLNSVNFIGFMESCI
jgi:hypothetical protein